MSYLSYEIDPTGSLGGGIFMMAAAACLAYALGQSDPKIQMDRLVSSELNDEAWKTNNLHGYCRPRIESGNTYMIQLEP
jgi:hypothetical protein